MRINNVMVVAITPGYGKMFLARVMTDTCIRCSFGQALASVLEGLDTDEFRNNLMSTLKHLSDGGDGALHSLSHAQQSNPHAYPLSRYRIPPARMPPPSLPHHATSSSAAPDGTNPFNGSGVGDKVGGHPCPPTPAHSIRPLSHTCAYLSKCARRKLNMN